MGKRGLFLGLATLDLIYLTDRIWQSNQKMTAEDQTIAAGGPATNASVTFSYLGNRSTLLGILGDSAIARIIKADLKNYSIKIVDLDPTRQSLPPVSSIIVTRSTGERAVVSINAAKFQADPERLPSDILQGIEVVLIDGHQMAASFKIAQTAKANNIPTVIDGGSWKPGFEKVLPFIDYAICSADFYPPECRSREDVFSYLQGLKVPHIAISDGEKPIEYLDNGEKGKIEVPKIETAIDTLGAGDIFHGAFCHYILQQNFKNALASAAKIASHSCKFFGTRQWMRSNTTMPVEGNN